MVIVLLIQVGMAMGRREVFHLHPRPHPHFFRVRGSSNSKPRGSNPRPHPRFHLCFKNSNGTEAGRVREILEPELIDINNIVIINIFIIGECSGMGIVK